MDPAVASICVATIAAVASIVTAVITTKQNRRIRETHHQVSVNHHSSENPTLLDRLDDIEKEVRGVRADHQRHIRWHLDH